MAGNPSRHRCWRWRKRAPSSTACLWYRSFTGCSASRYWLRLRRRLWERRYCRPREPVLRLPGPEMRRGSLREPGQGRNCRDNRFRGNCHGSWNRRGNCRRGNRCCWDNRRGSWNRRDNCRRRSRNCYRRHGSRRKSRSCVPWQGYRRQRRCHCGGSLRGRGSRNGGRRIRV